MNVTMAFYLGMLAGTVVTSMAILPGMFRMRKAMRRLVEASFEWHAAHDPQFTKKVLQILDEEK